MKNIILIILILNSIGCVSQKREFKPDDCSVNLEILNLEVLTLFQDKKTVLDRFSSYDESLSIVDRIPGKTYFKAVKLESFDLNNSEAKIIFNENNKLIKIEINLILIDLESYENFLSVLKKNKYLNSFISNSKKKYNFVYLDENCVKRMSASKTKDNKVKVTILLSSR